MKSDKHIFVSMIAGVLALVVFAVLHINFAVVSGYLSGNVVAGLIVTKTNTERSIVGAGSLARNIVLDRAATLKARDMLAHQYFAHTSPAGITPWYWIKSAGYVYRRAGENLAVHFNESEEVVRAWMESPSHRANIVNNAFTEIGIGIATGTFEGKQTTFVVQLFGLPQKDSAKRMNSLGAAVGDAEEVYTTLQDTANIGPNEAAYTERIPASTSGGGVAKTLFGSIGCAFLVYGCMRILLHPAHGRSVHHAFFQTLGVIVGIFLASLVFFTSVL